MFAGIRLLLQNGWDAGQLFSWLSYLPVREPSNDPGANPAGQDAHRKQRNRRDIEAYGLARIADRIPGHDQQQA